MALRFIEYLAIDGNTVTLYIQEEKKEGDRRCFRIQVRHEGKFEFIMCREKLSAWEITSLLNFPDPIILDVLPLLQRAIEKRLEDEEVYLWKN